MTNKNRDVVGDAIALSKNEITSEDFNMNFANRKYDSAIIHLMFTQGYDGADDNAQKDMKTSKQNIDNYLGKEENRKHINSVMASSLYNIIFTRVKNNASVICLTSVPLVDGRQFNSNDSSFRAAVLLSNAFKQPTYLEPYTAYKLYMYPHTPENNPDGLRNMFGDVSSDHMELKSSQNIASLIRDHASPYADYRARIELYKNEHKEISNNEQQIEPDYENLSKISKNRVNAYLIGQVKTILGPKR